MPKSPDTAVRLTLVERAAEMLARREPVTLRALVDGTGASTMAVYTHFGGMPGLRRAVRQEGFSRLSRRLELVPRTKDPVRDLGALGAAYVSNAIDNPHLYRAMFETEADLEDADEAARGFSTLVTAARDAQRAGRFSVAYDSEELATQYWATGHGLAMLVIGGVLPAEALDLHGPAIAEALFVAAGDQPARCRRSVRRGWRSTRAGEPVGPGS